MIKQQRTGEKTQLTFVLPKDEPAGKVSVVGDFNDWTPGVHTLVARSNGTRSVKIAVTAGESYRFRYLGENGVWFDEADAERADNDNLVVA